MLRRLTARITGQVQGVGFRWFVQRIACSSGLTGYVRNMHDGSVEVVAEGEEAALQRLLDTLRQGSSAARVENIDAAWTAAANEYPDFGIEQASPDAIS